MFCQSPDWRLKNRSWEKGKRRGAVRGMLRTNPCFRSFAPMPPFLVIPILLGSSVRQLSPSYWPNPISNNRAWAASSLFLSWDTQIKRKNTLIHTQQDRDLQILLVWARATSQPLNQQVKVLSIRSSFGLLRPSFVESKTRTELFDGESSQPLPCIFKQLFRLAAIDL